jgi:alcohol dehydrogenase YqhD (iron-dependent ADH family)
MAEGLMKSLVYFGRKVRQNPDDYATRAEIMWIGTVAHNDTVGVGRNQDWSVHNIGNELSALYDTPHGATLSIVTPHWMKYVYKDHLWRFERFAEVVFGIPHCDDPEVTALAGIDALTAFFRELGMPTCFSENRVEIPTDRLEEMSQTAANVYGTGVMGAFKKLYYEDVLEIFKAAAK